MNLWEEGAGACARSSDTNFGLSSTNKKYLITVNEETGHKETDSTNGRGIFQEGGGFQGIIDGFGSAVPNNSYIRIDQGLDTDEIDPSFTLSQDLVETQFIVQIDNRLGRIVQAATNPLEGNGIGGRTGGGTLHTAAPVSFIDDDNIATYYFSFNTNAEFITDLRTWNGIDSVGIQGPRGTSFVFSIDAQLQLQQSDFLFNRLGTTSQSWTVGSQTITVNYIDSTVKVTGATTGYSIDVPVRFVKKASS